ncbi:hypothetical protein GE061_005205 [Apolygus lucorum]|uniref:UDP-glycosyltransferases domain-containing protein n=1 Tax=Apolygus lucorum TaxID=248454 RepID=A0A8S9WV07_APOLU|nr:hypothetical protein GE061_005205 [Apolygus lucorum]
MVRLGLSLLLLSLACLQCIHGARILAFLPMPWRSHQFVFRGFIRGLAAKGHQVDFYTPTPMSDPPSSLNQIKVKDRLPDATEVIDDEEFMNAIPARSVQIVYDITMHFLERMYTEEQLYTDLLQSKKKYDLVITEYPLASEHSAYLAHKFKIPSVAIMGYYDHPWTNEISGLPDNPSYMVSYLGRTSDKMNFFERLHNFYITSSMILLCYWETLGRQQEFADRVFRYEGWETRPKLTEMISQVDLILVNSHVSFGYSYPKAPHVKDVGGMHINPPKPLPKDLEEFMNKAPHGVIFFSLGSVVDAAEMLKNGKAEIFVKVFKTLKQKVVWKTAPGLPEIKAPNIFTKEWMPQQDILGHNNTVLFITHGGLQSMVESINFGVPTIGMPVFFDQYKDVKFMTTVGMGLPLHYDNISEETVRWSINEVINNPSYREAARKRQAMFRDRPMSPVEEAVYWVEYVLRHGSVLRPASADMPFYQVYLLDVLGAILLLIILSIYMLKITIRAFCSVVFPRIWRHQPNMNMSFKVLLLLLGFLQGSQCLRILMFDQIPWRSHQFIFKALARGLGERGHLVDFYAPLLMPDPPKTVNQILLHDTLEETLALVDLEEFENTNPFRKTEINHEITSFDALSVVFAPLLDHPWTNELSGLTDNPSYMLSYQSRTNGQFDDFSKRLQNTYRTLLQIFEGHWWFATRGQEIADALLQYEGWESRPPLSEVARDAALILLNTHPSMSYPYPKAPHVKEIGGIHVTEPKPLPKVNQKVLWKIGPGMSEMKDKTKIKMQTWFPQQDILAHKNLVLFITHGGLQSTVEAINNGVPILGMPVMYDQYKDVEFLTFSGMGLRLNFDNITEETLTWSINEILTNPRYRQQAKKRQLLFRDRPMKPLEEAIYWIEYVGRHGKVLQPASVRLPFYQLYLIDVIGTILLGVLLVGCHLKAPNRYEDSHLTDMNWLILAIPLFFVCWQSTSGAKILAYFPLPWRSHQNIFKPLVKELAIRGHQVDFFTCLPIKNPPVGLNQKIVNDWQEKALQDFDEGEFQEKTPFEIQRSLVNIFGKILDWTFEYDQASIDLLNSNETYDLVLTEFPVGVEPMAYIAHKFKAINVAIVGFPDYPWINELSGLPDNPSYMVNYMNPLTDKLNFWQRLHNSYVTASIVLAGYYDLYTVQQSKADKLIRYEGWENRPKLMDMIAETALILVNSHPSTNYPYPRAPHVKEIAGIHIDPASQPLPKDLQDFMDDAPDGVIFFSLGSVLDPSKLLVGGKFEIFLNVFQKLKQKVMWKIADGLPEIKDPKIRVQKWYPQQSVLGHKNLKMFITHGGQQSTLEAISFGVPCLGIPFIFDQQKDVAYMEKKGMAKGLTLEEVTEDTLSKAINEILSNPKYRENAQKQKAIFEDRPRKPVQEGAYWIEYVLRHGPILRPASATMPFYQVYLLDVAATAPNRYEDSHLTDMNWLILAIPLFFVCWQSTSGAKILAYFPLPWRSHQNIFKPLVKELAIRGHQVDFFTCLPIKNPPVGLNQKIVNDWQEKALQDFDEKESQEKTPFDVQRSLVDICGKILDWTFEYDQASIDLLNSNETYDLVLTEFPVGLEPMAYIAHKFKAINVAIVGFPDYPWINELSGLPDNPSYMVNYMNPLTDKLNFWQRLHNSYVTASIVLAGYYDLYTVQQSKADKIIRYEGWENRPKLMDMIAETALILVNSHPSTNYPYPRAPHVKEIAGIHIDPASQPLPKDLQDFMDDAPDGVIFFSLGSVLDPSKLLVGGKFETFLNVFQNLKQKVMWKIADGLPEIKDPKIRVQKWYPQQSILDHKNLKMFITHGGQQSTLEAISFGVPCLGIPFFFDQQKDVAYMEKKGMAKGLTLEEVTEETLSKAINEILSNPKYRENAQKQKAIFEDRPRKPVQEGAYWIEYVLRHGPILRPASATMPLYQVYLLDVAATKSLIVISNGAGSDAQLFSSLNADGALQGGHSPVKMRWCVLILLVGVWECTSAARILAYFPLPWKSHQFVVRPLMKELAKRGHHVDFITSFPMPEPPKGVAQRAVKDWQNDAFASLDENEITDNCIFKMQTMNSKVGVLIMTHSLTKDQASIDILRSNETYDAVITEFSMGTEGIAYLAHKFQAVSIVIMGLPDYPWLNEMAGLPDNPSYMMNYLNAATEKLSFWERLYNAYAVTSINLSGYIEMITRQQYFADEVLRYEGWEDRPKLSEIIAETALILTNSHPSTGFPYPRAPHVKEVSGIHIDPQPLPKDLQDFMDDAPQGVIYFSLGSVLDPKELLADGKFEEFLKVFRQVDQKVMWKVAPGMPEVKDPKIKLQTWFPQQGILAHKNIKLFITHGGLQSTIESISFGVPTLGMPFFFDQKKDVAFMKHIGMGLELSFDNITESSVSWSLNELLNNDKYRASAIKQQTLFHDRPMKPVEEAAYWVEYVLRHGKVLRPASATMPFYQLYLLDVAAFILTAIVVMLYIVKWSCEASIVSGIAATMRIILLTVLACLTGWSSGARILAFFPFAATSHHMLFEPIVRSLCERGHHVTYLSPNQFKADVPNLEKIPFQDYWPSIQKKMYESQINGSRSIYSATSQRFSSMYEFGRAYLGDQVVKSVLQSNRHYDAVLTESWFFQEFTSVFAHRFNALRIVIQTFGGHAWTDELSGLPSNPSYMYDLKYFKGEHPKNFFERLYSLYTTAQAIGIPYWFTMTQGQNLVDELVRYPGWENRPRLSMLASDAALVLRNSHFSIGYPVPTAPHVKDVGGLNVDFELDKKEQLLDSPKYAKFKAFMDKSNGGFIYFSLGSVVKPDFMLPPGLFGKLYGAFSKLQINVMMRWSGKDTPSTPSSNILLYDEFLPQMEILAHKNIKAFMTHGGLLSINEAINFGVPIIGMPVFGDQPMNVKRAVSHGYGVSLSILNPNIPESLITATLNKVIKKRSFKEEAVRRSYLFRDRIMRPVEEAVYWIEYVLRHGKVLQPASALMPFYQVYLLDVIAALLVALLLGLYVVRKSLSLICSLICGNKRNTQSQEREKKPKKE